MAEAPRVRGEGEELARRITRQLWLKLLLVLFLLAAASASAFAVFHTMISAQGRAAELINDAGRQRHVLQRLAISVQQMASTTDAAEREALRAAARAHLNTLLETHARLDYGSAGWEARNAVLAIRTAPPFDLDRRLEQFAHDAGTLLGQAQVAPGDEVLHRMQEMSGGPLLDGFDAVVEAVEEGTREGAHNVLMLASIGEGMFLILLLIMALTVFRPLVVQTSVAIGQLSALQRYHKAVVDAQADGIVEIDPIRRHMRPVNPAAFEMFGLDTGEQPPLADLVPAASDLGPVTMAEWSGFETQARDRHGKEFAAEVTVRETQVDGTIKWIGVVRDVSKRVAAETRAHILLAALEHSPASIVITDIKGTIEYVNRKFCEVSGYGRDEITGKPSRLLKSGLMPSTVYTEMWQVLNAGREWRGEMLNRKKSGELFWEFVAISPLVDPKGQIAHYMAVKEDITERKNMEQDLIEAKVRAERASRAKSDFLATMSHELRTPLNAIIGFSELMMGELFGPLGHPNYAGYLKDVHESGHHLLELINDVLDLSKVEAGKIELDEGEVDVPKAVEAVLRLVSERSQRNGVTVVSELSPDLPLLWADPLRIKQVLLNLLTNAIKFTPAGGKVTVRTAIEVDGAMMMSVSDTGIGIAASDIPLVMEPFGQVNNPMVRKEVGTGLGLPLTKRLVELQGGTLTLASTLGKGTTVSLRFPADRLRGASKLIMTS